MIPVYTGVYDDTAAVDDLPEGIECPDCGWPMTGTYCEVCTPCDDCHQTPALCRCTADCLDPLD